MASCAYCNSTILFGGSKAGNLKFCNNECLSKGQLVLLAQSVPENVVAAHARNVHSGPCPRCKDSRGPVEVHTAYKVTSFLIMTSWSSSPRISCNSCGRKHQLGGLLHSLLLGWWGFPWGLLMTPVQIGRNIVGMVRGANTAEPSPQLQHMIRMGIASQAMEKQAAGRPVSLA